MPKKRVQAPSGRFVEIEVTPGPDPTFDATRKATPAPTGGLSGVIHTKEQEEEIRRKARSGRVITQSDL